MALYVGHSRLDHARSDRLMHALAILPCILGILAVVLLLKGGRTSGCEHETEV